MYTVHLDQVSLTNVRSQVCIYCFYGLLQIQMQIDIKEQIKNHTTLMQEQDLDQETEADLGHRLRGGRGQAEAAGGEAHQGQGPPVPLQAGEHLNTLIIISHKKSHTFTK